MKNYKHLTLITVLYITFQLVSDITAGKIISFWIFTSSVTILYFPFTYIISDILTEVYGYSVSRSVVWKVLLSSTLAGLVYQLIVFVPGVSGETVDTAYSLVLGSVPRILIGGWIAVWTGAIVNDYVLAKMKILTRGKYLFARTIGSTIVGEGINTFLFYTIALCGIINSSILVESILSGWLLKVAVETFFTPITYKVVSYLKMEENEDYYDHNTNFNPFKTN